MGFRVRERMCGTCIYRPDSPLDLAKLEGEVRDGFGFTSHRICHSNPVDTCCRGFWNAHKDEFQLGQVAQRLNCVEFVKEES